LNGKKLASTDEKFNDLRKKAEKMLALKKGSQKKLATEVDELIHKLEVQHIELEMQNENLTQIQIELEESKSEYKELYDFAPVAYLSLDQNWIIQKTNLKTFEILGVPRKYLINTAFIRYISPESKGIFHEHCQEVEGSLEKNHCEIELLSEEVNPIFVSLDSVKVLNEKGSFKEYRIIITDITVIKETEREIEESNRRLNATIDAIPDLMFDMDEEGRIYDYNAPAGDKLFVQPEHFLEKKISEVLPLEAVDKIMQALNEAAKKGKHHGLTYKLSFPEGTRYFELSIAKKSDNEQKQRFIVLARDITSRRKAEQKIKQSLQEKEILLKEIHHRVKNNLMVISSLLNLQSDYIKDKTDKELFRESQTRTRSMALIHERIYQSTDLHTIDFGNYVKTFASELYHTYDCHPNIIKLKIDMEPIPVDINTAIPCGLIIHEFLSNAIKHAFPKDKNGEILIEFYKKDDKLILKVKDNGIGLPADIDLKKTDSLGLKLVNALVSQIDGELEINSDGGTEFKVIFPETLLKLNK
jgi:PAS domain S-box-containing protein